MTAGGQDGRTGGGFPTSDHLWPLALLACLFAFVSTHPIRPHDFWWHLATGREIVVTHHVPQYDTYSYTVPGKPYPSYNIYWLADVALYEVFALGGPALNVFAHTLLITGTYGLLFLLCLRRSRNARIAAVAVLAAAALGFENWNLRPQAVTFLLFTLVLWLIYTFRAHPKPPRGLLLGFPLLMIVWVNCHGSFPLALAMIGIWLVETVWERVRVGRRSGREVWMPAAALALSAAATVLNPQGAGIFDYLRQMAGNPMVQRLPEWAPASFATPDGLAFFVLAAAGLVMLLWAGRARSGLFHWLMLIAFALLAWRTGRAIVWFGLVLAPLAAELLPRLLPAPGATASPAGRARSDRTAVALIMLGFVALMVVTLPWFKDHLPLPEQKAGLNSAETPVRATDFMLAHRLPGRVFHDMSYGSYFIWAASPQTRVFVDPRIELYPGWLWDIYDAVSRGDRGWQHVLDRYGVNTLMLSKQEQPGLVAAAGGSAQWQRVYEDRQTVMFVRRGSQEG